MVSAGRGFAVVWSVATWVHLWNHAVYGPAPTSPDRAVAWALTAAVVAGVASGGRGPWLLAAAVLQVAHVLLTMPEAAEHWMLVAAGNVALLAAAVGARTADPDRLLERAGGTLRALILVCYGAAAISKFNWGFLDLDRSCATELARLSAQFVPLGPDVPWMHAIHVGGALLAEGAVAVLLMFPGTRRVGIGIGVLFHVLISFTPAVAVFDFTATLFAFWWLFAPEGTSEQLSALGRSLGARYAELAPHAGRIAAAAVVGLGAVSLAAPSMPEWLALTARTLAFDAWALLACTVGLWAVATAEGRSDASILPRGVGVPLVALALLDVAAPYLGLKSVGSFTMYSNLRTEGGVSNHLVLPVIPVFPQLSELATIESSTDPWLAEVADRGEALPLHELRRRTRTHAGEHAVTWTSGGARTEVERAGAAPELVPSAWERWLLVSRPVQLDAPRCQN